MRFYYQNRTETRGKKLVVADRHSWTPKLQSPFAVYSIRCLVSMISWEIFVVKCLYCHVKGFGRSFKMLKFFLYPPP